MLRILVLLALFLHVSAIMDTTVKRDDEMTHDVNKRWWGGYGLGMGYGGYGGYGLGYGGYGLGYGGYGLGYWKRDADITEHDEVEMPMTKTETIVKRDTGEHDMHKRWLGYGLGMGYGGYGLGYGLGYGYPYGYGYWKRDITERDTDFEKREFETAKRYDDMITKKWADVKRSKRDIATPEIEETHDMHKRWYAMRGYGLGYGYPYGYGYWKRNANTWNRGRIVKRQFGNNFNNNNAGGGYGNNFNNNNGK